MDDRAGAAALHARDDVRAGIAVGIAGRSFAANETDSEAAPAEPFGNEFRAGRIGLAGRIDGRKTDEVGGERDELVDPRVDGFCKSLDHGGQGCSGCERLARGHAIPRR
jgi:hypothetical protein